MYVKFVAINKTFFKMFAGFIYINYCVRENGKYNVVAVTLYRIVVES